MNLDTPVSWAFLDPLLSADDAETLRLAEAYRNSNPDMAAYMVAEVAARRTERVRRVKRCRRCTWTWHAVGDARWRCMHCMATRWEL